MLDTNAVRVALSAQSAWARSGLPRGARRSGRLYVVPSATSACGWSFSVDKTDAYGFANVAEAEAAARALAALMGDTSRQNFAIVIL